MKAYILIQAEPGSDDRLVREVRALDGVGRVDRVSGPYDLIAEGEWARPADLVQRIRGVDGVLRALTSLVLADDGPTVDLTPHEPKVAATGA